MANDEKLVNKIICSHCGKHLDFEWNFCPQCKNKIETVECSCCKNTIKSIWNYCPYCKSLVNSQDKKVENIKKERLSCEPDQLFHQGNQWLKGMLNNQISFL